MARLRELSHTADVGFEATAATPEELFEVAARGLVRALGLEPGTGGGEGERVTISRPDGERLLVQWLRELLEGTMSGRGVPAASVEEIRMPTGGPASLRGRVRWIAPGGEGPAREIKGVTYHGLAVERAGEGWHARVVLDV